MLKRTKNVEIAIPSRNTRLQRGGNLSRKDGRERKSNRESNQTLQDMLTAGRSKENVAHKDFRGMAIQIYTL